MVMRQRLLLLACAVVLVAFGWALFGPACKAAAANGGYVAPLPTPLTVLQRFDPPAKPWLSGNRGVDLAATTREPVVAAADGVVLYAGLLAGRGVVSVDHGALRTTYEPVDPVVSRGESVRRGEVIGLVSAVADGCGPPGGCLHWGALRGGAYIDPLGLLGPRTVRLLPVWTDGFPLAEPTGHPAAAATGSSATRRSVTRSSATGWAASGGRLAMVTAAGATAGGVGLVAGMATRRRARSPTPGKVLAP